jgi:hypothetical protein
VCDCPSIINKAHGDCINPHMGPGKPRVFHPSLKVWNTALIRASSRGRSVRAGRSAAKATASANATNTTHMVCFHSFNSTQ